MRETYVPLILLDVVTVGGRRPTDTVMVSEPVARGRAVSQVS
jgi:hypothetical protein